MADGRRPVCSVAPACIHGLGLSIADLLGPVVVTRPIPDYLKIHTEADTPPPADGGAAEPAHPLSGLCRSFARATGWSLQYIPEARFNASAYPLWHAPVHFGAQQPGGFLALGAPPRGTSGSIYRAELDGAKRMACDLADLVEQLGSVRRALARSELDWRTELRPGSGDDPLQFAARSQAVLSGGAEGVGCHAAALYLLDAATTRLRMAASWGLPAERMVQPPRPLRGALGDLEALSGHAVVLEDASLLPLWSAPEDFASAVCVPVASPTTILGTLWMFSRHERDFTNQQTGLIEIVAGRLAADVEREVLLVNGRHDDERLRGLAAAEQMQATRDPHVAPVIDGWQLAGFRHGGPGLSGHFFDWSVLADGSTALALGDALEGGPPAALLAAELRAALRAHARYCADPDEILGEVNRSLWASSPGDQFAAALAGRVTPGCGTFRFAAAGRIGAVLLQPDGHRQLAKCGVPLAMQSDAAYSLCEMNLEPQSAVVMYSDGLAGGLHPRGVELSAAALAEALPHRANASAAQLVEAIHDLHESSATEPSECAVVVLRRTK